MAEENLTLIASVEDDFRDPLDDLSNSLLEIGLLAEEVFPIDVDVSGGESTFAELKAIEEQVDAIDDSVSIDTDVDSGVAANADAAMGMDGGPSVASADGGGGFLNERDIQHARETYGDAFDPSALLQMGGGLTSESQLLEGGMAEQLDQDAVLDALFDPKSNISLDLLRDVDGGDLEAFEVFKDEGLTEKDGGLLSTFRRMKPKMGDFYMVLAALVPLIGVFVGAMPAAIAAVGGLAAAAIGAAGALGAIGGLALMGMGMEGGEFSMSNITDRLEELRESFVEAFAPLANRLEPLAEDAFAGVERLFTALASQGDALMRLRKEARALGGFILDVVPPMVSALLTLGNVASPIFASLGDWIKNTDFIAAFASILGRALPHLYAFASAIVAVLPVIIDMSMGFLFVASSLAQFLSLIFTLVDIVPGGAYLLGALAATALTVYGAFALANLATGLYTKVLSGLGIQAMGVTGALGVLTGYISRQGLVAGLAAFATNELALSVSSLFTVLSLGLAGGMMLMMIDRMTKMRDRMSEVTSELKNFKSVSNNLNTPSMDSVFGSKGGNGGSGPTYTSFTDNRQFQINANSRDSANRAAQSMSFNTTYTQGKNNDTQFTTP